MERIESQLTGIGQLLKSKQFNVPPYQRPYAWTDDEVTDLLKDMSDAITKNSPEYFLGTLVIAKPTGDRYVIIDGQQRLVTVSIILAAIRDHFANLKTPEGQKRATILTAEFLSSTDLKTLSETPKLELITSDNGYYRSRIISDIDSPERNLGPETPSQIRISKAATAIAKYVATLAATTHNPNDRLLELVSFINDRAKIIVVEVSDEENAYIIFEVLNDRGLELSIADLLKNYLFRIAGSRVTEAQNHWIGMSAIITETGTEKDIKSFIRHYWSSRHGVTREKQLYDEIKKAITSEQASVDFAKELASTASFYSALSISASEVWKPFGAIVGEAVDALEVLNAVQMRPLLIATLRHLPAQAVQKVLPMFVAWQVRFMIAGRVGTGTLETYYAERAKEISSGATTSADQIWASMKPVVPTDEVFEAEFNKATVSKHELARFYLRVLEKQSKATTNELIVNPSEEVVTLEHILPQSPGKGWEHFTAEQQKAFLKRIGNLALLDKKLNGEGAGNADFSIKKLTYAKSSIKSTADLATVASNWTAKDIDERQAKLAKLAIVAWQASPRK
jgi:Protein of unknown function DUF262/Protein of unknown function (DUF1524)